MQSAFKIALSIFTIIFGIVIIVFYPIPIVNLFYSLFDIDVPNPFYILVLGVDNAGEAGKDRTDFIGILGLKTDEKKVFFMSIPRDLSVESLTDHKVEKINAVYKKLGLKKLVEIIEDILEIRINRYIIVDYQAFKILGDELGPVRIEVEKPMHYDDYQQNLHIHFDPGIYKMKGKELLEYVRFRHDEEGDIGRMRRQKKVLKAVLQSAKEKLNFLTLPILFKELLKENVKTDIDIVELVVLYWKYRNLDDINFLTFPYKVNVSGGLVIDTKALADLRKEISQFKFDGVRESKLRILLVKNNKESIYSFEIKAKKLIDEIRKQSKVISVDVINSSKEFNLPSNFDGKNTMISLTNEIWKIDEIRKVSSIFKISRDDILIPGINGNMEEYYAIIDSLGKNRIYMVVDNYDFIAIIGGEL